MLFKGKGLHFPSYLTLRDELEIKTIEAKKITTANDEGNFELSWELLAQAIEKK